MEIWETDFLFHLLREKFAISRAHRKKSPPIIQDAINSIRRYEITLTFRDVVLVCSHLGLDPKSNLSQSYAFNLFCKSYRNDDLPEVISLLCAGGLSVERRLEPLCDRDALMSLAENQPICRPSTYQSVAILINRKANVKCYIEQANGRDNALLSFLRNRAVHCGCCCLYGCLNGSKFLDTLELFIDSGIDVNEIDGDGFNALKRVLVLMSRASEQGLCVPCFERNERDGDRVGYLGRSLAFLDRLLEAGARAEVPVRLIENNTSPVKWTARFLHRMLVSLFLLFVSWALPWKTNRHPHGTGARRARHGSKQGGNCCNWASESASQYVVEEFGRVDEAAAIVQVLTDGAGRDAVQAERLVDSLGRLLFK